MDKLLNAPGARLYICNSPENRNTPSEHWPKATVKWSGDRPPPPVGSLLTPRIVYQGFNVGTVKIIGYDVEHTYLYAVCRPYTPDKWPKGLTLSNPFNAIYVAGCDLLPPTHLRSFAELEKSLPLGNKGQLRRLAEETREDLIDDAKLYEKPRPRRTRALEDAKMEAAQEMIVNAINDWLSGVRQLTPDAVLGHSSLFVQTWALAQILKGEP